MGKKIKHISDSSEEEMQFDSKHEYKLFLSLKSGLETEFNNISKLIKGNGVFSYKITRSPSIILFHHNLKCKCKSKCRCKKNVKYTPDLNIEVNGNGIQRSYILEIKSRFTESLPCYILRIKMLSFFRGDLYENLHQIKSVQDVKRLIEKIKSDYGQ